MKKFLSTILLIITCFCLNACYLPDLNFENLFDTKNGQTTNTQTNNNEDAYQESSQQQYKASTLEMDEKQDFFQGTTAAQSSYDSSYGVGRCINALTDKYIEVSGRYTPVFDSQKLLNLKWIKTKIKYQEAEVISDTSATKFQQQLSNAYSRKTTASIGVNGIFTAGLENDFSISNEVELDKDTKEIIAKLYQNINGFSIEIEGYNDYRNFYNMLDSRFINYLIEIRDSNYDEAKINQLFDFYGTHIVMAGYYGGRIECNYHLMFEDSAITDSTMLSYKNNAKTALTDAQYSASVSSGSGYSIKNKISQNITSTLETFTYKGRGGSYFAGSSIEGFMSNYSSWVNSFNDDEEEYSVLVDIPDKALMPVWLVIPSQYSDVATEIEKAFKSKADYYYNQWLQKSAYKYKEGNSIKPLADLTVYNDTIRKGEYKVAGSGRLCSAAFSLNKSVSELKRLGYNKLNVYIDYQLREQDNCWIYVNLYDENNNSLYYRRVEHGGGVVNYSYSNYTIDLDIDINSLPSNKFRIQFQAENKIFKDFYVGTVTGKVTAFQTIT